MTTAVLSALQDGRAALRRGAWETAREHLAAAAGAAPAHVEDPELLEELALAAFWLEDGDLAVAARQRAYALHLRAGHPRDAGRVATWLAWDHSAFRGEHALAGGWLARAHRALDPLPDCPEQAWLALREAARVIDEDAACARDLGARARELSDALGLPGHAHAAGAIEGLALVCLGRAAEGIARVEDAAATVDTDDPAQLVFATLVLSQAIDAREHLRDFAAMERCAGRLVDLCERWEVHGLVGVARAHRAGALAALGRFADADAELARARAQIASTVPGMLPGCLLRLADLRRQQGRLADAAALADAAPGHARQPPARAATALEAGDRAQAARHVETALAAWPARGRIERAVMLELLVRAGGEHRAARLVELCDSTARAGTGGLLALADRARGAHALAGGAPASACEALTRACDLLTEHGTAFDAGCARTELAQAYAALGRRGDARREAARAAAELARLGAPRAAQRARSIDDANRT